MSRQKLPLFRREALAHQQHRLFGDVILFQPRILRILTLIVLLIVALGAVFLVQGSYSRKERVSGFLVPDTGLVKIYSTSPGVIQQRHVEDGDWVEKGALLFEVSTRRPSESQADKDALIVDELRNSQQETRLQIDNLEQLQTMEAARLSIHLENLRREQRQLDEMSETLRQQYSLTASRLEKMRRLEGDGFVSSDHYRQQQEAHLDQRLRLQENRKQSLALATRIGDLEQELEQLSVRGIDKLSALRQSLAEINQRLIEIASRRAYNIVAPVSGRVTAVQAESGETTRGGALLMAILPAGARLQAELFVPTRAIGFIEPEQAVQFRYASFPYQHYGLYGGHVVHIDQVILRPDELSVPVPLAEPVYRVTANLERQYISAYGKQLSLQAGMLLEADIIQEERNLAHWLLEPIYSLRGRI